MIGDELKLFHFELWASRTLDRDVFAGVTTNDSRRERLRALLIRTKRGAVVLDDAEGWETWACRFERAYHDNLILTSESA